MYNTKFTIKIVTKMYLFLVVDQLGSYKNWLIS